jgi:glucose/arabinose dehydrogenase
VKLRKIGDFDQPVYVTAAPGDSHDLFVVEQTGKVEVVHDGKVEPRPFFDISHDVSCCGEQGLLSIAFPPNYQRHSVVYADYTDTSGDTRVVKMPRSEGIKLEAYSANPVPVLAVHQPFPNHNGGQLQFGPDGDLYVGLGDGGSEDDPDRVGQDLSSPLAKILRLSPKGKPLTAPALASQGNVYPGTFAFGLRNPWRFSFDAKTGDVWIGDVGQDTYEEVDGVTFKQAAGANFGWSAFEGNSRFNTDVQPVTRPTPPVLTYTHANGCSVTGGYVVRDRSLPTLYGRYVYGDFCNGDLRSFPAVPGKPATDDRPLGLQVPSLSSFGQDAAGHVYATSLEGAVYELVAAGE